VQLPAGSAERELSLGAFNYCGRDIAYVPIVVESGVPRVDEVELLSPCSL